MSTVCREIFRMLGAVKRFTSSAHAQTNGMVERLNHTLYQMLSHLIADNHTNWDELLLHAIAAHNNSVNRGTGLAPNEIHIGLYQRLPMTILERRGARDHQGLRRDHLDFLQLMRERQNRAYELVRKEDFLIKAKHQAANEKSNSIFRQRPNFAAGQWVRVYDDKSTISGGGKHVLKASADGSSRKSFTLVSKLAHCWTGPYKVLLVGPGKAPDGDPVGRNLLGYESRILEAHQRPRLSTQMQEMLQPARGRAKTAISALGHEFICPEQVLGPVATLPLDC